MTRREFMIGAAAGGLAGCVTSGRTRTKEESGRILFGACRGFSDAALLKRIGYDFIECACSAAFLPEKDEEAWKRQRDLIRALPIPLRSANCFIPGTFRLTGPKADPAPALAYGETVLRRADEVGVKTIVFGSGGARSVPGDYTSKSRPDIAKGLEQFADFCRELARRTADLKNARITIEPLRPNETNLVNYVWQGQQLCERLNSPRVVLLADIGHMMAGGEPAASIRAAKPFLWHCHVAEYGTRMYPGHDPERTAKLVPYFETLREIGYAGGVSCECGWDGGARSAASLETALETLRRLSGV